MFSLDLVGSDGIDLEISLADWSADIRTVIRFHLAVPMSNETVRGGRKMGTCYYGLSALKQILSSSNVTREFGSQCPVYGWDLEAQFWKQICQYHN